MQYWYIDDVSDVCRRFYGQFNNITSVLGKQSNEIVHMVKTLSTARLRGMDFDGW